MSMYARNPHIGFGAKYQKRNTGNMKALVQKVPIPIAGVALGLSALGMLLVNWSLAAYATCGIISLLCVIALALKVVLFPRLIRDDLNNSIMASTSGTLFMSVMQLSTYLAFASYEIAFLLWACAVIGHAVLIVWFTNRFIRGFELHKVFPSYFICYVGIIVASATSATYDQQFLGYILFWFGFVCYVILFGVITCRYAKHEVPEAARPLFCIYAAPMSLSLVGYLATAPNPNEVFVCILLLLAQFFYFFVLFHLPKFLRLDFYPSFAAMTFPFVIAATALLKGTIFLQGTEAFSSDLFWVFQTADVLLLIETIVATGMVLFVFGHYVRFFYLSSRGSSSAEIEAEILEDELEDEHFAEFFED